MKDAKDMIIFINKSLLRTKNLESNKVDNTGLKLSKIGEQSVIERWNKSEKNGGYTQTERDMV